MAWIYLVDVEESPSPSNNILDQLPIVTKTTMHKRPFSQEWKMETSQEPPSGTMCVRSMEPTYPEWWTSYTEDSLVRTSLLQDMERAWLESEADFSTKLCDWSKRSIPLSSSWKTCQPLGLEVFEKLSVNLQIWGMTVGGLVYLPERLEPRTCVSDGSSLPTPTVMDSANKPRPPRKKDGSGGQKPPLLSVIGGPICPTFVEWMMGYPLGWTELKPWVMVLFQNKLNKRLKGC